MNEDQQELLSNVPEDGTAIGNVTLKQKLGWPDEKYWAVRHSLIVEECLLLGRGRGGSVRRAPPAHEAEVAPQAEAEELPEVAVAKAEQKKRESDLYEPAIRVLDTKWSRDLLLEQFFVQRTAAQGRRETGGTWTRPDIVAIYVASYQYLPTKILNVVTFEIKPVETADVTCVYEALAHLKAATQAFVPIAAPDPNQANVARALEAIAEEAGRHGIGLIVARDITDYDTWDFRVDAVRREPDPTNVDEFIETQISEANKAAIAEMGEVMTVSANKTTTAQSLGSLIKAARDIMRKDKGLNGDLDRLPMLTWIMFLKFLDDLELQREEEATLAGKKFQRALDPPYRWRDWAAKPEGITGDELISFVNNEEAVLPDGSRGPGLFDYLRSLTGRDGGDRRDVIATVFKGTINRMINGYLLRDVINKVSGIQFGSSEELHTLGALYETMLREMRDAAGDSGEFYTPRPVVRFMVAVVDPKLSETVLDPACGTGGFLVEAFGHLEKQCKTVQDRELLQKRSIFGGEAKPLPYLLAQMNLLLHGLESPQISPNNSLAVRITEVGEKDRVDIILTNPPFGGEEERGILANFPSDKQTAETALLFLQLIMRKIRRAPKPGRAAVVVPNGTLFGDGVCARIKEELLKEFNLHTIVRLPNGVFAPYTSIPTNILFFDRSEPSRDVWYYEQPLPEGRKTYTKTQPMRFEGFADCLNWWNNREENELAWKIPAKALLEYNEDGSLRSVNLDRKNPRTKEDIAHLPPDQLAGDILKKEQRIAEIMNNIISLLAKHSA